MRIRDSGLLFWATMYMFQLLSAGAKDASTVTIASHGATLVHRAP